MTRKLYQIIASRIQAAANCDKSGNAEWKARHLETVQALVADHLPSGGGFDNGSAVYLDDCTAGKLTFATSFHHMDEHGSYDGWTDHKLTVRPSFDGIELTIGGRDRNGIKDYIHEAFHIALSREFTREEETALAVRLGHMADPAHVRRCLTGEEVA